MVLRLRVPSPETQKKYRIKERMVIVYGSLLLAFLIILARLIDLQIIRGEEFRDAARAQHYGGIILPARRGEILSRNSKTGETSILATNTTLDLVYVDPYITDDPPFVAETLADILVTEEFHAWCSGRHPKCPRELLPLYAPAFDPLEAARHLPPEPILEPLPTPLPLPSIDELSLPNLTEARRLFAREIEKDIREKRVTFVPLKYGATRVEMKQVQEYGFDGIAVSWDENLIYGNPQEIDQGKLPGMAKALASTVDIDASTLRSSLSSRPLRYVPVLHQLPPELLLQIKEKKLQSFKETQKRKRSAPSRKAADEIRDPLRGISLLAEHWRFYPDGTIASHIVGFLNTNQEAQYGIERTFDPQLKGHEGIISAISDPSGGQIASAEHVIVQPKDGDSIVLTIDRHIQKETERLLSEAVMRFEAESGQVIIMDPFTGRILALANAPLFESNTYGSVYEKEAVLLTKEQEQQVVVEIVHPTTNARIVKAYYNDIFTPEGRGALSEKTQKALGDVEELYNLSNLARYYSYSGENSRREVFPTVLPHVWLRYKNTIGVGAYLNRTIQEIYEPGSVLKPVTMAIAIDQGEVSPSDFYNDTGPVNVDEYTIRNALLTHYGLVTMTNCLEFSINTCMTSVSAKLGKKLFHHMLQQFGFQRITGIELEDELPGEILPWRKWSNALLATAAYGQGISATPLQVLTAFAALANGGKLVKPTIIDSIVSGDGEVKKNLPKVLQQVITEETSQTITGMLVNAVDQGYAKPARVRGYRIAGKTGTSQIAGPGGKYETGTGASLASFAGYAPALDPKFVMIIKFDRPRTFKHGAETAAPLFKEIATFLFKYYGIPPDEE